MFDDEDETGYGVEKRREEIQEKLDELMRLIDLKEPQFRNEYFF